MENLGAQTALQVEICYNYNVTAEPVLEKKFKDIKEGGLITCYVDRNAYNITKQ